MTRNVGLSSVWVLPDSIIEPSIGDSSKVSGITKSENKFVFSVEILWIMISSESSNI